MIFFKTVVVKKVEMLSIWMFDCQNLAN